MIWYILPRERSSHMNRSSLWSLSLMLINCTSCFCHLTQYLWPCSHKLSLASQASNSQTYILYPQSSRQMCLWEPSPVTWYEEPCLILKSCSIGGPSVHGDKFSGKPMRQEGKMTKAALWCHDASCTSLYWRCDDTSWTKGILFMVWHYF